jgi:hypothetical protein
MRIGDSIERGTDSLATERLIAHTLDVTLHSQCFMTLSSTNVIRETPYMTR